MLFTIKESNHPELLEPFNKEFNVQYPLRSKLEKYESDVRKYFIILKIAASIELNLIRTCFRNIVHLPKKFGTSTLAIKILPKVYENSMNC